MALSAFFAYPNDVRISGTITAFVTKINNSGLLSVETWEQMQIGGKLLISEICRKIESSDLFCADITRLNPNVLFEIGFAIARKKRVWLIRDTSIPAENADFKQFRVLTTLGYREYLNSDDILVGFYRDLPHESLAETVYDEVIEPSLRYQTAEHILYLKSFYEDEASVKVTQFLDAELSRKHLQLQIDDPREASIQPLSWYAMNVHTAQAVVCHLTTLERENSKIQNAKHSLVAGMAHGLGIPILLLIENDLFGPADYRDLLVSFKTPKEAVTRVAKFVEPLVRQQQQSTRDRLKERTRRRKIDELAMLQIGEPIAEHEEETIANNAFIETAAYHAALSGSQAIFVGRKGVGKTANFKQVARALGKDKRVVVCEIKPLSYELEALVSVAKRFELMAKKGFLFESLWKFLIYSELARQVVQSIEARPSGEVFSDERGLIALFEKKADLLKLDFSARLDRLSNDLLRSNVADSHSRETSLAISELLHGGIIHELLEALIAALQQKIRILVLVDNLDKAWDRSENTRFLSYFILGLLSAIRRVSSDFRNRPKSSEALRVSLCIFIRADIFEMVLEQAREPDKIQHERISWHDPARLRVLADSRLIAATNGRGSDISADALWERFFVPTVYGTRMFDYIFTIILLRPRDLLYFLRAAISSAVNRRHERVEEDDFVRAEEDYSTFVYQSMFVELREKLSDLGDIIAEFMGGPAILSEVQIRSLIAKGSKSAHDPDAVIKSLALSSFLEIEVPARGFVTVADETEYGRLYRAAWNASDRAGAPLRFRIHRAFRNTLVIEGE